MLNIRSDVNRLNITDVNVHGFCRARIYPYFSILPGIDMVIISSLYAFLLF